MAGGGDAHTGYGGNAAGNGPLSRSVLARRGSKKSELLRATRCRKQKSSGWLSVGADIQFAGIMLKAGF